MNDGNCGDAGELTQSSDLKRHGPGHFLRRDSNATGGRRQCGGRFLLYREDDSHFAIDPVPNRLVLFDATVRNDPAIEEMGAVPEGWWRSN